MRQVTWVFLQLLAATSLCAAPTSIVDFSSTGGGYAVKSDVNVTSPTAEISDGEGGEPDLRVTGNLEGAGATWLGCEFPVEKPLGAGADTLYLQIRAEGRTAGVDVVLNETDGTSWTSHLRVKGEWSSKTLALYSFEPSPATTGTSARGPVPEKIKSIEIRAGNTFQGSNGFSISQVAAADEVPDFDLKWASQPELTQQKETTLTLEARGPGSDEVVAYNGDVLLGTGSRQDAILPRSVAMVNGRGEVSIFPRKSGTLTVYTYNPHDGREQQTEFQVRPAELAVNFSISDFLGQQVMLTSELLAPKLSLQGNRVPLTAHVILRDHKEDAIISSYISVPDIHSGKGKLMVPRPGLFQAQVRLLAEPLALLPHVPDNTPVRTGDVSTTVPELLPEGVTTRTVFAHQVYLEEVPTTATVLGEDRFSLLVQLTPPKELFFNRWQFGLHSGDLFALPIEEFETTGRKRLRWHRRLGSSWVQNDIPWNLVQTSETGYQWQKANSVINTYRDASMKLMGTLLPRPAWQPENGLATSETRSLWQKWVAEMDQRYDKKVWAWEMGEDANASDLQTTPDAETYRELVKTTWQAVKTTGTEGLSGTRVVAGSTSGFDPVFLDRISSDGFANYIDTLGFHFIPAQPSASPEENSYGEVLDEAWKIYRKNGLNQRRGGGEATQIWLTKMGWSTFAGGVSEEDQANYLVRAYAMGLHKWLLKMFWPSLTDTEALPWRGGFGAHTGLLNYDFEPKPAAAAYNLAAFMMTSMTPTGPAQQQGKATIYSFNIEAQSVKWPGILHIAWTPHKGDVADVELPMIKDNVYSFDYLGADRPGTLLRTETSDTTATLAGDDSPTTRTYRFQINHEPLYIWDAGAPPKARVAQ